MKKFEIYLVLFGIIFLFSLNLVSSLEWGSLSLKNNLTNYYKLDELIGITGQVNDSVGGKNGTNFNSTSGVTGKINTGYNNFSYSGGVPVNYIYFPIATAPKFANMNFTINVWLYLNNQTDGGSLLSGIDTNAMGFYLGFDGSIKLGKINVNEITSTAWILGTKRWMMITVDKNGSFVNFYVNGTFVSKSAYTSAFIDSDYYIGAYTGEINGTIDELGIWNRSLTASEIFTLYNFGNGLAYGTTITLNSPADNYISPSNLINFNCSAMTSGETNITNMSLWHNGTGTFALNKTNSITGNFNITNFTSLFADNQGILWTCQACYSDGTCKFASENRTLIKPIFFENSQIYNPTSYESANEQFIINLTYDSNNFGLAGNLNYNNINYLGTISGIGNTVLLTSNITIPTGISGAIPFYWNISLTNSSGSILFFKSNNYIQTIGSLFFAKCNSTINITILNFTIIDESNNNLVNSWFKGTFSYGGRTYSYQNLTESNNYLFCTNLNINLSVSVNIQYGATGYLDRTWYLYNQNLNNQTTLINLPLLNSSLGIPFYFDVRYGSDVLTDALVYVKKYYLGLGNYSTISIRQTDSKGQFQEYLELNQQYQFVIVKDEVTLDTIEKQSICSASPCTISLQISQSVLNPYDPFYDYFAQNIIYNLTYDLNSSMVYLNFTDLTGTAQYWRLWVYQGNSSSESPNTICDLKTYSAVGTMSCNFTGYFGDIEAKVFISRSPEKLVDFLNFVNSNISTILGESGILASIIILLVLFFVGTRNPTIAVIMIPFGFLILKFIGFFPLGWGWIVGITIFCIWISTKMKT